MTTHILFVQGGGADVHDQWDQVLVNSLRHELGAGYAVHYPRLPDEHDPQYASWAPVLREALAELGDGVVCIGHSVGGTVLMHVLAQGVAVRPGAVMLIAPPFVGDGGWEVEGLPKADLARGVAGVPVYLYHGARDQDVPPDHARLYARALPEAVVAELPGRDHQLNNDLSEIARDIRALG